MILLTASLAHPVYTFRYIVFCIPAAALLIGPAMVALGRYAGPAALIALLVIGLPTQAFQRSAVGHGIDIRRVDRIVARNRAPGDALLNVSSRRGADKGTGEHTMEAAYPYGLARLRDISTGRSPEQSGTLGGTYAPTQVIRARAATVTPDLGGGMDLAAPGRAAGWAGFPAGAPLGYPGTMAPALRPRSQPVIIPSPGLRLGASSLTAIFQE